MKSNIFFILFFLVLLPLAVTAQISSGKITYERKTNLYKKFKGDDISRWVDE